MRNDCPVRVGRTTLARLASADAELLTATPFRIINLESAEEVQSAIDWWVTLTQNGGEGMVVKPIDFIARNAKGLVQPALKCRGREYLRIIYGPEYDLPQHLAPSQSWLVWQAQPGPARIHSRHRINDAIRERGAPAPGP